MLAAKAEVNVQSRLDPRAYRLISKLTFTGDVDSLDPVQARRAYNFSRRQYTWLLDEVGEITEIPASLDGTPALKLFRPRNAAAEGLETYIFLHGGGWTLGDLSTYEPLCRRLANELGANVLWVEYRLAPEHPFPAALDDAVAAAHWVFKQGAEFGLDPERVSLIGDSAGGNIAAVLALLNRRAEYGPKFLRQVLIYPCVDLTASYPSHRELGEGYLLTRALYGWYRRNYIGDHVPLDWRLSPIFASGLKEAAPAVILRAGFDPLRDEAAAYGQRLKLAGVKVEEIFLPEMIHGFINMGAVLPQAGIAVQQIKRAVNRLGD